MATTSIFTPAVPVKTDILFARLLHTFTKSVMASVGILKLHRTHLVFIDPGMKINGAYCRDSFYLKKCFHVHEISCWFSFFNGESAWTSTLNLWNGQTLQQEVSAFNKPHICGLPTVQTSTLRITRCGGQCKTVYKIKVRDVDNLMPCFHWQCNNLKQCNRAVASGVHNTSSTCPCWRLIFLTSTAPNLNISTVNQFSHWHFMDHADSDHNCTSLI